MISPLLSLALLGIGFALLVYGADYFVRGSSALAKRLGVSSLLIGLTIVALGTSLPELAISVIASILGNNEIAVGNVIGSNLVNLLAILGLCAILCPLPVCRKKVQVDFWTSIAGAVLVVLSIVLGHGIPRIAGIIFLLGFLAILASQIRRGIADAKNDQKDDGNATVALTTCKTILFLIAGAAAIAVGAKITIFGAVGIARYFQLSERLIGLTIVAFGTSLPELVTSVVAALKNENDLAVGNVIGSNVYNIFLILGLSSALSPIHFEESQVSALLIDSTLLLFSSLFFFIPIWKEHVGRLAGSIMLLAYLLYSAWLFSA
ncbi:MAG: calcium/sodium antiporter [Kiritimatiellia bacterium]